MGMHIVYGGVSLCSTNKTHRCKYRNALDVVYTLHVATTLSGILVKSPHNVISVEGNVAHLTCNIEVCITPPTRYIRITHSIALLLRYIPLSIKFYMQCASRKERRQVN